MLSFWITTLQTVSLRLPEAKVNSNSHSLKLPETTEDCNALILETLTASIKAKSAYKPNECLAKEHWDTFLTGEEDLEDIHEFVNIVEDSNSKLCKKNTST